MYELYSFSLQKFATGKNAEGFSQQYRRDQLSDWLIRALEHAGRSDEVIPLCEREAEKTESYVRLVNCLKQAKRWKEVEHWIHKGIAATRQSSPGIADQLRTMLRERREQEKNWLQVAAFYAEDFFQQPGGTYFSRVRERGKAGRRCASSAHNCAPLSRDWSTAAGDTTTNKKERRYSSLATPRL